MELVFRFFSNFLLSTTGLKIFQQLIAYNRLRYFSNFFAVNRCFKILNLGYKPKKIIKF